MVVAVDGSGIETWLVFSVFSYGEGVGAIGFASFRVSEDLVDFV